MKKKKEKTAIRRRISKAVSVTVLAMFAICLIYSFSRNVNETQTESVFERKVNELVKEQYPDAEIVFRADPVACTYAQMPDEKAFEYRTYETLHDILAGQSENEATDALLLELETKMAELGTSIDSVHADEDIHYHVQKIRFIVGDSLMVHAFAKISPDYKECELEVVAKLPVDKKPKAELERKMDSIQEESGSTPLDDQL